MGTFAREPAVRGVFLVDANRRFAGLVTRVDLMRWAHLKLSGRKGRLELPIFEFFRIVDASKAMDLAHSDGKRLSVRESDPLQTALEKMLDEEEDVLPVLDSDGRVLGDLRLSEVLWSVLASVKRDVQR